MLASLIAGLAMQAAAVAPPPGGVCLEARYGRKSRISFVARPERLAEFQQSAAANGVRGAAFTGAACRIAWSPETTTALCAAIGDPNVDFSQTLRDTIGVSGNEICAAVREVVPEASNSAP